MKEFLLISELCTPYVRLRVERSSSHVSDLESLLKCIHQFTCEISSHICQDAFRCGKYVHVVIQNFVIDRAGCLDF
jgi:hypothetical protein